MPYNGPVTDPFRIPAPDGHVYFDALYAPKSLAPIYVGLADLIVRCRIEESRHTDPAYKSFYRTWGVRFDALAKLLKVRLGTIGQQTAVVATERVKHHIKATQVRPDTQKAVHMYDNVISRHIAQSPEGGAVGVGDIALLNRTTRGGVYWDAQEFGTDAHVGREIRGFFMPGRARPAQADFRVHPEFQAAGRGPRMTIQRPIEERGFLRRGIDDAGQFRARRYAALNQQMSKEIKRFITAQQGLAAPISPPRGSTPRPRR